MAFSAMRINQEIKKLTPYKYLDSLDTVRFRDPETSILEGSQLHAYGDFFMALLMGEGIVVPQNQLVDSLAFIDVASQLIDFAQKEKKTIYLNLRASLFSSTNVFELASKIIGNIGTDENNHVDRFLLSGWPHLDEDYGRRKKWSQRLLQGLTIPLETEYIYPDEEIFVRKLNTILEYFAGPDGRVNINTALPTKTIRVNEIHQVSNLTEGDLEELLRDLSADNARTIIGTVAVIKKLVESVPEIDFRSKVLNALVLTDGKSLNPFYFDKVDNPQDVYSAVLSVVDSIYNYSTGIGVNADLISHTAKATYQDTQTPSIYGLATWARLTNKVQNNFVLSTPNGLIVPSSIEWSKLVHTKSAMNFLLSKNFPWDTFFEATTEPSWRKSLLEYLRSLQNFQTSDENNLKEAEKKYADERLRHLDQSMHRIHTEYLNITEKKFEIRIKEIDELQMEFGLTKTTSEEQESRQKKSDQVGSTSSAELSGKLGPVPEVSGKLGGSFETLASISNEKYSKQSLMLQNMTNVKGRPSLLLKVNELKNYFEQQRSNALAIKGIIAAVKKGAEE